MMGKGLEPTTKNKYFPDIFTKKRLSWTAFKEKFVQIIVRYSYKKYVINITLQSSKGYLHMT